MSGGHFEYAQYKIADIYYSIEEYLNGRELDESDVEEYIRDYFIEDNEKNTYSIIIAQYQIDMSSARKRWQSSKRLFIS